MGSEAATAPAVGAWPGLELGRPLTGGARAQVWSAHRGVQKMVVRVSTRSPESLAWELDLTSHLHREGVSVPAPVPTVDGRRHDDGVWVAPFLPGEAPRDLRDWRAAAEVLTAVHDLTRGWPQRPGATGSRDLLTAVTGADVDLSAMPADAVDLVRSAWAALLDLEPAGAPGPGVCVVHGDLGPGALLVRGPRVSVIDWDESRVDAAAFDLAGLPRDVRPGDDGGQHRDTALEIAALAWETATCWVVEPDYARRRLTELQQHPGWTR